MTLPERSEIQKSMWQTVQYNELDESIQSFESFGEAHHVVQRWVQMEPLEVLGHEVYSEKSHLALASGRYRTESNIEFVWMRTDSDVN